MSLDTHETKCNHSRMYGNDSIRSVLLLHIRANLGMILAMTRGLMHTSNECSKQRANIQMACKKSLKYLNPIDHLFDLLKRKARAQSLQLVELSRVIHQMHAAIPQQYIHRHILSMST